jgi:lysine biosynthesis protein LysW
MEGKCPFCGAKITLQKSVRRGDIIYCPDCDAELEVFGLNPVELDWPMEDYDDEDLVYEYEDMEDYDDDDFDDDY